MPDDESERPKRSWREIDRARDLKHERKAPLPSAQTTLKGTAAKRYRSQLDRIFAGGGLPDEIKRQAPGFADVEPTARQQLVDAVLAATSPAEIETAVDALLATEPMPGDPMLLVKILAHPKRAHAKPALASLLDALESGRPQNANLLKSRVQALRLVDDDDDLQRLADCVLALL
ncbi:MAG: hypothetical protein JXR83_03115 [Deltaproteobacteria bacterium]|nr:hypothetical protein [Deltaproteobacteria bacterium]